MKSQKGLCARPLLFIPLIFVIMNTGEGNVAAIKRCEEIDAGNPTFSKMDEVLFIAGESSLRLAENKGKQKAPKDKTPEQLLQDARVYLTRLVNGYPNSTFFKQAQTDLAALGGPVKLEDTTE